MKPSEKSITHHFSASSFFSCDLSVNRYPLSIWNSYWFCFL